MPVSIVTSSFSPLPGTWLRRRHCFFTLFCGLILTALLSSQARAQNARAILQQSLNAYQKLNSYSGVSSVDFATIYQGKKVTQESLQVSMKMKRPNFLLLNFSNPKGSRQVISDGKTFTFYNGYFNQYKQYPTAPDMTRMLFPLLSQNAGVRAELDPLYFLSMNQIPASLSNFQFKGHSTFNGKPVLIVSAALNTPTRTLTAKGRKFTIPAVHENWTWWINAQTNLLEKVETTSPNTPVMLLSRKGKKVQRQKAMVTQWVRHTVLVSTPNDNIAGSEFIFHPPANATENKSVAEIPKSGGK